MRDDAAAAELGSPARAQPARTWACMANFAAAAAAFGEGANRGEATEGHAQGMGETNFGKGAAAAVAEDAATGAGTIGAAAARERRTVVRLEAHSLETYSIANFGEGANRAARAEGNAEGMGETNLGAAAAVAEDAATLENNGAEGTKTTTGQGETNFGALPRPSWRTRRPPPARHATRPRSRTTAQRASACTAAAAAEDTATLENNGAEEKGAAAAVAEDPNAATHETAGAAWPLRASA